VAESRSKRILLLGAVTTVYFLAGRFGLSLAFINESASAVWPPSGIAVAALLLLGVSAWPAVTVGSFLVNLTTSGVALASAAIAALHREQEQTLGLLAKGAAEQSRWREQGKRNALRQETTAVNRGWRRS
jgi:hypothetical protein